jgi:hypothetical protein
MSKEAIVCALAPHREYHPGRDDNALFANLRRLRRLIAPLGVHIESTPEGYRLLVPAGFSCRLPTPARHPK